jgi:hypothetical protein
LTVINLQLLPNFSIFAWLKVKLKKVGIIIIKHVFNLLDHRSNFLDLPNRKILRSVGSRKGSGVDSVRIFKKSDPNFS